MNCVDFNLSRFAGVFGVKMGCSNTYEFWSLAVILEAKDKMISGGLPIGF